MFRLDRLDVMQPRGVASQRRLLVATSLGAASEETIRGADTWAGMSGGELIACHVDRRLGRADPVPPRAEVAASGSDLLAEVRSGVRQQLRSALGRRGADVPVYVAGGEPASGIAAIAEALHPDLLVVGAPPELGAEGLAFGSVAEDVVRRTRCAVLVARPPTGTGGILVAPDFSDDPLAALRAAVDVARSTAGRVTIVHALSPRREPCASAAAGPAPSSIPGWGGGVEGDDPLDLASPAALLQGLGVDSEARIYREDPVTAVLESAEALRPELCVVAMDPSGGFARGSLGDAAGILLHATGCSVLVVRPVRATA